MKLEEFERHKENPYIKNAQKYMVKRNHRVGWSKQKNIHELLNTDTGEVESMYNAVYAQKLVDTQKYVKLYLESLHILFSLNKTSQKVLEYLYSSIQKDKDYVEFSLKGCMQFCGYKSKRMVYVGLSSLIDAEIIARSEHSTKYYINPTVLYNGNRLLLIQEYIKRG